MRMEKYKKMISEDVRMGNYCSDEYDNYEEELRALEDRAYNETSVMEEYYESKYGE